MIDLLIAGGGPAGLATALYAAKAGVEAVVVERRAGPIDKACGEGMMPHAVAHLERLGVDPPGRPLGGIRYVSGARCAEATFGAGKGRGVRRTVLHRALLDAAAAAGIRIVEGRVGDVVQDEDSVRASGLRARYLVAADGLHSPIRRELGLARAASGPRRTGIRRHYAVPPWSDSVEVHWSPYSEVGEAYVTPVSDDCVGVAILSSERGGFDDRFAGFPALRERLVECAHGPDRAAGPLRQNVACRTAGRVMLVGDAAGYVDALTGEGIGLAFGGAEVLVDCVTTGRVDSYDRRWRRLTRRYRLLTEALVAAGGLPAVRRAIVPVAATLPAVFDAVVNQLAA